MDPLIEQIYKFDFLSVRYGHFLCDLHDAYPEVLIDMYERNKVRFKVPEGVAVLIKLKYGDSLYTPPKMPNYDSLKSIFIQMDKEKARYHIKPIDEDLTEMWNWSEKDEEL